MGSGLTLKTMEKLKGCFFGTPNFENDKLKEII